MIRIMPGTRRHFDERSGGRVWLKYWPCRKNFEGSKLFSHGVVLTGARGAAAEAMERILKSPRKIEESALRLEYKITLPEMWSSKCLLSPCSAVTAQAISLPPTGA